MPIRDECQETIRHTRIVIADRGRSATFINREKLEHIRIEMDGCVVHNALAADWVLKKKDVGDLIIELKGKDVEHAVQQVMATARYLVQHQLRTGRLAGLVVAKQYHPRASTSVQRAQQAFTRAFSGPLHVASSNYEYTFERVLDYGGPR